jgi:UDP-N-acetylmuramate dehydrogenase
MAPPAGLEQGFALARLTTIGTGGPARWFARPGSLDELAAALRFADDEQLPVAVVGLGSNLLIADAGFDGLVIRLDGALAQIELDETSATCGGGASLAALVRRATDAGLSGIEFGCAIPGTVGGAVRMNAGAYGGELRDVLAEAVVVSAAGTRHGGPAALEMSYRHSNVAAGEVVASAVLRLTPAASATIRETVRAMQARRSAAQPRKARTFGSVFKNPERGPGAGALLEACELKGFTIGGARISTVHANFIENAGGASSTDVAALIGVARARARARFGVELEHEVELLGPISIP